jgi:hypothetical protein
VTEAGVLMLDARAGDDETAARLAHLVTHLVDGAPYRDDPADDRDGFVRVAEALLAEARALDRELAARRALGVRDPVVVYELAAEWAEADEDARVAVIADWLEAHPDGGPGVDALGRAFRDRCERAARGEETTP